MERVNGTLQDRLGKALRREKISDLAAQSAGFTGAQIASVCNLAALRAVRRAVGLAGGSDTGKPPLATQAKALIVADDLAAALAEISPKP